MDEQIEEENIFRNIINEVKLMYNEKSCFYLIDQKLGLRKK